MYLYLCIYHIYIYVVYLQEREDASRDMTTRRLVQEANDYRIVVLGSAGVGKTSLLNRFTLGTFSELYSPTVEDTYAKVVYS